MLQHKYKQARQKVFLYSTVPVLQSTVIVHTRCISWKYTVERLVWNWCVLCGRVSGACVVHNLGEFCYVFYVISVVLLVFIL